VGGDFNEVDSKGIVMAAVRMPGEDAWRDVMLTFYGKADEDRMALVQIAAIGEHGISAIMPEPGMRIRLKYPRINLKSGDFELVMDAENSLRYGQSGLSLRIVNLPRQRYRFGALVEDFSGNFGGSVVDVTPIGG
jgi:hypothetical protein